VCVYFQSLPTGVQGQLNGFLIICTTCSRTSFWTRDQLVARPLPIQVVPLCSIEAHLGDRRYSSCSFLTSALEWGEWSESRPGRALPPRKKPPVPTVQEAGWAPEPVWTQRLEEKSSASVGDRTPSIQFVVSRYTDRAARFTYLHSTTQYRETKNNHPCPKRDSNLRSGWRALKASALD
jgi:hypothetical protein